MNGGKIKGFEYHMGRSMRGELRALTVVDLGFDRRVLRVETDKGPRQGGVWTTATVVQMSADGLGYSHMLYVDYSKRIAAAPGRATEKLIRTVHERALLELEATIGEVRARYAPPVATGAAELEAAAAIAKAQAPIVPAPAKFAIADLVRKSSEHVNGGRAGTAEATRAQLLEALGEPTGGRSSDGKVTIRWGFQTPRGMAEVRDYWWNAPTEWSIGAENGKAARWLAGYLRRLGFAASSRAHGIAQLHGAGVAIMKYRVTLTRMVHDSQSRTVEVEAKSPAAAKRAAQVLANQDDYFWNDVRQDVGHNDAPTVEACEELLVMRAPDAVRAVNGRAELARAARDLCNAAALYLPADKASLIIAVRQAAAKLDEEAGS